MSTLVLNNRINNDKSYYRSADIIYQKVGTAIENDMVESYEVPYSFASTDGSITKKAHNSRKK